MVKKMNICGLETAFTDENDGEVVLFLHGWGSNKFSFVSLKGYLCGRKICLD